MNETCVVCGRPVLMDVYALHEDLWKAAGLRPDDRVHIDCLPEKIGRALDIADFDPTAPANRVLFYGYRMGRRCTEILQIPDLPPGSEP